MPQQVERNNSISNREIYDNNNQQHIFNQNEGTQQRSKRSRQQRQQQQQQQQQEPQQQQQKQQQQHIYENLPISATSQQLRKYFRREAIYENLCRGCGYGVFAAQGRYCHFCQCIVSGSVVAALQQQPQPQPQRQEQQLQPLQSSSSQCNIYENICELCRGIYSDSEACKCAASATPTPDIVVDASQLPSTLTLPTSTSTSSSTSTIMPTPTAGKAAKPRTLLGYSKSSAATLTRLFGSLKQLNRSGSLQRRLFQKEATGNASGKAGGGSLEIIHNVDEVFRTQQTFDMQRICELKRQLQCSRSDQHIYGRLRGERETEPEPEPVQQRLPNIAVSELPGVEYVEKQTRKKPRISRMRLLRHDERESEKIQKRHPEQAASSQPASIYLNESICQWMNALRHELHSYEDINGRFGCQQPKSVPPAYERERERERELDLESELVTLRRSKSPEVVAAAAAAATPTEPANALQQRMVNDFKRKLLNKREPQQLRKLEDHGQLESNLEQQLELVSDRRRCGINERHDSAFVSEFLSGLALPEQQQTPAASMFPLTVTTEAATATATATATGAATALPKTLVLLAGRITLAKLWENAALASSLHRSVICFFGYDKLLSAFLHSSNCQRRQRLRLRSVSKVNDKFNIERWLLRYRRLCESNSSGSSSSNNNITERESASASTERRQRRRRRRRLLGPPSLELAVVPATPASDDGAVAWRVGSDNDTNTISVKQIESESKSERENATKTRSKRASSANDSSSRSSTSSSSGSALMAAPKQCGDAERSNSVDSENNSYNNNNNNNTNANNNNNSKSKSKSNYNSNNNSKEQLQQQHKTQNCVIKVRRPAPQVPVRNPSTSLSKPRNENDDNNDSNNQMEDIDIEKLKFEMEEDAPDQGDFEDEEESIYQTIWQFKTLEPAQNTNNDEEFEIIATAEMGSDEDDDADADVDVDDDAHAEALTLQAAAAFAAGARHKLTKQTTATITTAAAIATAPSIPATPAMSPLPSPTASMDHGAWETDDEFMFAKSNEQQQQQERREFEREHERERERDMELEREIELERERAETLSVGSTVTNSTATLGSISSSAGSSSIVDSSKELNMATAALLTHPTLRNVCILYSLKDRQKYSAIFYDYQRAQIHQRFMTRIRRPAPPPPLSAPKSTSTMTTAAGSLTNQTIRSASVTALNSPSNDDSGCSCEADNEDIPESIPQPLREDWALAVLAAAASNKRGVAARAGRKLRVRSSARRLIPTSVLAWREQLQDVNCCEDEEDMIVPVTDILRAQQIKEENELQQAQQTTILQRFKSASIGNLVDLPGEDDKKSIKNRMRMKFTVNSNVFRINRSPKSEKKSRSRRSQVNSLCLEDSSKYPLFGARLSALELNMTDHPNVPRFVVDICAHIERPDCIDQDGLYRASGNKVYVDELKRKLSMVYDPRCLQVDDIHTLTSLHKQFFRELPNPLITQEAYDRLGRSLTDDVAIERMRLTFDEMPEPNRSTLRFLIKHLTNIAAFSSSNRMPASNLAIVWGPCLLAANDISFDIGRMNMLAKVLIENYPRIFRPDNERLVC